MSAERYGYWDKFEERGSEGVRRDLAAGGIYGEARTNAAREWLAYRESLETSESNRASLAEAKSANDLARSANTAALEANSIARFASDSAKRSAKAAWTSNIIAAAALIAAIIAMVIK